MLVPYKITMLVPNKITMLVPYKITMLVPYKIGLNYTWTVQFEPTSIWFSLGLPHNMP